MAVPLSPPIPVPERPPRNHGAQTIGLRFLHSEVTRARRAITQMLAGLVPASHLNDVESVTSELVTNGLAAAERYADAMQFGWQWDATPVHLSVYTTARWTRIDVTDPEPYMLPRPEPDLLAECGRGLLIVEALGHRSCTLYRRCKVMHAVLPIGTAPLTAAEIRAALPEETR